MTRSQQNSEKSQNQLDLCDYTEYNGRRINKSEVKFIMTEKGKQILDLFEKIVPDLSEVEMEKL